MKEPLISMVIQMNVDGIKYIKESFIFFRCMYCSDYYWNKIELTHHRNLHTDVEYKCEKCEQVFYNRDSMYSHCTLQHSQRGQKRADEEYICDLCAKRFTTKAGVRSHLFLHMSKTTLSFTSSFKFCRISSFLLR